MSLATVARAQTKRGQRIVESALEALGGFFEMCAATARASVKTPFEWGEFVLLA